MGTTGCVGQDSVLCLYECVYLFRTPVCLNWTKQTESKAFLLLSSLVTGLIFYDTKVTVMNRVLNATVQRTADHAAPEITLDPLEIVGGSLSFHLFFTCFM